MGPITRQQSYEGSDELRNDRRFKIELLVLVSTPTANQNATIVNLSRRGIRLRGIAAPRRSRICVHYRGQLAEGTVRWLQGDEIGVAMDDPLSEGALAPLWQQFQTGAAGVGQFGRPRATFGRKTV